MIDTFRYLYLRKFNANVVTDRIRVSDSDIFIKPNDISTLMGYLTQFHGSKKNFSVYILLKSCTMCTKNKEINIMNNKGFAIIQ